MVTVLRVCAQFQTSITVEAAVPPSVISGVRHFLPLLVFHAFFVCFVVSLVCFVVSCLVCIVVLVLCVLLSSYVYLLYYVCIAVFALDAGLLARSQYSEGPATGHLDTGFSWFPCA